MVLLRGLPIIGHVINALTPQTSRLVLGLREPTDWAAQFALPIITDTHRNVGPVASIAAILSALRSTSVMVLTAPADSPFLPNNLALRLHQALASDIDIAVAVSLGQRHHLIALWRTRIAADVEKAIEDGVRSIHALQNRFRVAEVSWPITPTDPFFNINTPDDLILAEAICSSRRGET
jgi:molybdopterin-guanine dinucleotide biosynthesis protein A